MTDRQERKMCFYWEVNCPFKAFPNNLKYKNVTIQC